MNEDKLEQMLDAHELYIESGEKSGRRLELIEEDLNEHYISGYNLKRARFVRCLMRDTDMSDLMLNMAEFVECDMTSCDLSKSYMVGTRFTDCVLNEVSFRDAELEDAVFVTCAIKDADFHTANMSSVNMARNDIRGSNFYHASMEQADLNHVDASKLSADDEYTSFMSADLRDANLQGANLTGASLGHANLTGTNFAGAIVHEADFLDAYVDTTNFDGTIGRPQTTPEAGLDDASFVGSSMHPLNLSGSFEDDAALLGIELHGPFKYEGESYIIVWDDQTEDSKILVSKNDYDKALDTAVLWESPTDGFWNYILSAGIDDEQLRFAIATSEGVDLSPMGTLVPGVTQDMATELLYNEFGNDWDVLFNVAFDDDTPAVYISTEPRLKDPTDMLVRAKDALTVEPPVPRTAYGRSRKAKQQIESMMSPMRVGAFKQTFPEAFELIKRDIRVGTLQPESARQLISQYGMTWNVTHATWPYDVQRLSPKANKVMQLNIDLRVVTDDPDVRKTIEAIRSTSYQSEHPVRKRGLFTVGWVRYSEFPEKGVVLIEEVQSDLPIVRKGLSDEEFQKELHRRGQTDEQIRTALDVLQPYVERFYMDAISLVYDIAHEAGLDVEMLSYSQKKQFNSPRSLYEKLPKYMGMKKGESELDFIEGKVWRISPNPKRRRPRKIRIAKSFTWRRT